MYKLTWCCSFTLLLCNGFDWTLKTESNTEHLLCVLLELPLQVISPVDKCGPSNRLHSEILQVPFTFFRVTFVDTGNRMFKTDFSFPHLDLPSLCQVSKWNCSSFVHPLTHFLASFNLHIGVCHKDSVHKATLSLYLNYCTLLWAHSIKITRNWPGIRVTWERPSGHQSTVGNIASS